MLSDVREILQQVSDDTGVPVHLILAHTRRPFVVHARREAMRRLAATGRSLSQVARLLGLDHSTVWYALRRKKPPAKLPWHKPRIRLIRGKLLEMYYAWPVQDLSLVVFRSRRRIIGRDGTNVRACTAVRRHDGTHGQEHRDRSHG